MRSAADIASRAQSCFINFRFFYLHSHHADFHPMSTPSLQDRIRGMIWGQLVGDAAALGAHWIYDLDELARAYPNGIHGFEEPREGHYHFGKHAGDQTHYGDGGLLLLESMAECGAFDTADFARRFVAFFGNPNCKSYRDAATKETLQHLATDPANLQNGAHSDDQPATVTRLAAVVAVHRDNPAIIGAVTRFAQNNAHAVEYALAHAQILSALLDGMDFPAALDRVTGSTAAGRIAAARAAYGMPVTEATSTFGQACPLPRAFPAAVHATLSHPADFRSAILSTIRAGGDNAARASMIGAWLGASLGIAGIPEEWRNRLTARETIRRHIEELPL